MESNGVSMGFAPNHERIIKMTINREVRISFLGVNANVLNFILDNGRSINDRIAEIIIITPPNLFGMERRIA